MNVRNFCLNALAFCVVCIGGLPGNAAAQFETLGVASAWGINPARVTEEFSRNANLKVVQLNSSAPANVLWPQESLLVTFQVINRTDAPIKASGKIDIIQYGLRTPGSDVFNLEKIKIADITSLPITLNITASGFQNITVKPAIPETFGAYALILDIAGQDRFFGTSVVRALKPPQETVKLPSLILDNPDPVLLKRIGAGPNRMGWAMKFTTDKDFEQYYQRKAEYINTLKKAGLTTTIEFGHETPWEGPAQIFERARPHLNTNNNEITPGRYPADICPQPSYDTNFTKMVYRICSEFGYPKGPIIAIKIWNEPWEGGSIAYWGADLLRFRELTHAMWLGLDKARKDAGIQVLTGGADSHSNTLDKLFGDGSDSLLKCLDFCSIHYEGMSPPSLIKSWINRKSPFGRVKIWDTESWVGNSEDRATAVIACNRATGHDRAVGIVANSVGSERWVKVRTATIETTQVIYQAWSVAPAVAANSAFLGERKFKELLFQNGLPWVMVFDGLEKSGKANADDGTVVVVGDLGPAFGPENLPFRSVRGLAEVAKIEALRSKITDKNMLRIALDSADALLEGLSGASLTIDDNGGKNVMFDFYGNPIAAQNGKLTVPLDGRGFFLRGNKTKGAFAGLLKAIKNGRIDGYEPLATVCHDLILPIDKKPTMQLELTNILNRPVSGTLAFTLGELTIDYPAALSFKAHETKTVAVKITGGTPSPDNTYALSLAFNGGKDGTATHRENMHVNVIAKRAIKVDGKLDDWQGVLPQTVKGDKGAQPTLSETAWFPYKKYDKSIGASFSSGYLAYDKDNFYFAARIADTTPDAGLLRFETRNDDEFFYPETTYDVKSTSAAGGFAIRWSGTIIPKFSELYAITTVSDDGVRVWINDSLIIENWTDHGATDNDGRIKLDKNKPARIKIEYYQGGGAAAIVLKWQSTSQKLEIIPAACMAPLKQKAKQKGLTGEYFTSKQFKQLVTTRIDTSINFTWSEIQVPDSAYRTMPKRLATDTLIWPAGVRRFSYRKNPTLPCGSGADNIQIAFNVIPTGLDGWIAKHPGTMQGFTTYKCTDHQYALNQVATRYGGGTEIWRVEAPNQERKHFYPRQPKTKWEGAVKSGTLVMTRDSTTRYVECSIPWSEFPLVKKQLDLGKTIKFSFRVNDNGGASMELGKRRSVAKRGFSFNNDWEEHWANEIEFGFEK